MIETAEPRKGAITHLTGRLYWNESATVRVFAPIFGRVCSIRTDLGEPITTGLPLAKIDSPDFGQALADARTSAGNLAAAAKALDRAKKLLEAGAAPQKDVEAAEAAWIAARVEHDRAEARLANYGGTDSSSNSVYVLRAPRAIVIILLGVFLMVGVNSFLRLPVEAYPDVTNVSVQIITLYPGHAAEEVERLVTIPLENAMNGIPKRVSMRSISLFGLSQIALVFEDNADNATIWNLASQLLGTATLPAGAQAGLSPDATPIGEIFRYTLKAPQGFPDVELRALEDWVVEKKFRTVPGVVDVNPFGGPIKQCQVLVDPVKLKSYNLTLQQVFTALSNGNNNAGGSYVEHGSELYVVRGIGVVQNLADIEDIAMDTRSSTPIRICDIARFRLATPCVWGASARLPKRKTTLLKALL